MAESRLALFTMLSQLLIDYTFEFDAAMLRELGQRAEPPSLAMWANVLQYVRDDGIKATELRSKCGIAPPTLKSMIDCLKRHGWITLSTGNLIALTAAGREAARAFPKAIMAAEQRCESQWGRHAFESLLPALEAACARLQRDYPAYPMPSAHRGGLPAGD